MGRRDDSISSMNFEIEMIGRNVAYYLAVSWIWRHSSTLLPNCNSGMMQWNE
jgi:hypothetical protein